MTACLAKQHKVVTFAEDGVARAGRFAHVGEDDEIVTKNESRFGYL